MNIGCTRMQDNLSSVTFITYNFVYVQLANPVGFMVRPHGMKLLDSRMLFPESEY